ncbi:MAG: glycosyltransferase family 2 protein, partial [Brachybacterium sp.]
MTLEQLGVVIPVHGDIAPVLPLLTALAGPSVTTADRAARVVVVDDASPQPVDAGDLPAGVELLRRGANGGFGAAVNTGLAALAQSPVIDQALVLNSDLEIPEGFCRAVLAHAAPWQPAVVGCRIVGPDGHSGYAARYFPTIGHQIVEWLVPLASQRHRDVLHRAVGHDLDAERGAGMIPVDWVSGAVL